MRKAESLQCYVCGSQSYDSPCNKRICACVLCDNSRLGIYMKEGVGRQSIDIR